MKKLVKAMTAFMMALAAVTATATTGVFAENTYTPIQGTTVSFEKYLIFDSQANTPATTFTYSISAGNAIAAVANKSPVLAGDDVAVTKHTSADPSKTVIENITVGTAVFNSADDKYTTVQEKESGIGQSATLPDGLDPVTLATGEAYSRHKVLVDFSKVQFSEPGVYRYIITESAATAEQAAMGISVDTDSTRYLDVYVADNGFNSGHGSLSITGYVLHNTDGFQPINSVTATPDEPGVTKAVGYTSQYVTNDLTISKTVSGNQASSDKYFKFVLALTNAGANSKIDVDITNADATVGSNSATIDTYEGETNASVINTSDAGVATYTFYLQHGQSIAVKGLPLNTSYTLTETAEDYTPTATITGDTINGATGSTAVAAAVTTEGANSTAVIADSALTADTTIAATNTRTGTIPTGIVNSVLPGIAVIAIGMAGLLIVKSRKQSDIA